MSVFEAKYRVSLYFALNSSSPSDSTDYTLTEPCGECASEKLGGKGGGRLWARRLTVGWGRPGEGVCASVCGRGSGKAGEKGLSVTFAVTFQCPPVTSAGWKRKMAQNLSPDPGLQLNKCSLSLSATFAWPGPHRPAGWARRKRLLVSTSSPLSLSLTHSTFSCLSSFLPRLPSSSASHRVRLRAPYFLTPSFTLRPLRPAHSPPSRRLVFRPSWAPHPPHTVLIPKGGRVS